MIHETDAANCCTVAIVAKPSSVLFSSSSSSSFISVSGEKNEGGP